MQTDEYRRLGASGLAVSTAGLGCNNLGRRGSACADAAGVQRLIDAAVDAGITLFDVADRYGPQPGVSEEMLGVALGKRRHQVVIASKFGMSVHGANGPEFNARGSRRYIRIAAENSLRRLNTDWIDLYQFHEPDQSTPIEETLSALDDLVRAGKIRYIGHSNLNAWQLTDAAWTARSSSLTPFISAQNEFSLLRRRAEIELLPAARAFGLGVLPYRPLANGLLTGKYTRDHVPTGARMTYLKQEDLETAPWDALSKIQEFAAERNISILEVAFGWLLSRGPVASVIAGATTADQVWANARAARSWSPTAADLAAIDEIVPPAG